MRVKICNVGENDSRSQPLDRTYLCVSWNDKSFVQFSLRYRRIALIGDWVFVLSACVKCAFSTSITWKNGKTALCCSSVFGLQSLSSLSLLLFLCSDENWFAAFAHRMYSYILLFRSESNREGIRFVLMIMTCIGNPLRLRMMSMT